MKGAFVRCGFGIHKATKVLFYVAFEIRKMKDIMQQPL